MAEEFSKELLDQLKEYEKYKIFSQYKQEFSIEGKSSLKGGLDVEKVEKVANEEHIVPNVCDEKDMLEFMIEMHHRLD